MQKVGQVKKGIRKSSRIIREEGLLSFGIKAMQKFQKKQAAATSNPQRKKRFTSLVDRESVMAADWVNRPYQKTPVNFEPRKTISWVMSPPSGGGGHQNIFRFIEYLDAAGYENHVYLYSTFDDTTVEQAQANVRAYCNAKGLKFHYFNNQIVKSDIVFATGWETAYPVFNLNTDASKHYFIQDFEPLFYPMGTDYVLAENTYKFGFRGITAGGWLSEKLSREYGMECDYYDFGANTELYKYDTAKKRNEIFFYARPVTERRGFDLGIMALEIFHKKNPEYVINLAGWDVSEWDIPFPYINHGAVSIEDLPVIYNRCAAALVMSLTNMSLLPLELLACGTIPVVNDGLNNRLVSSNEYISYTESSPVALAQTLDEVVNMENLPSYAKKASKSVSGGGWDEAGEKFIGLIEKEISRG